MLLDQEMLSIPETTTMLNGAKDLLLERLCTDKVITEEQRNKYSENYQIIVIKPSWFSQWKQKFMKDKNNYMFKLVKFEIDD